MKYIFFPIFAVLLLLSCQKKEVKLPETNTTVDSNFTKAIQFSQENKNDSAFYYFDIANDIFIEQKDSLRAAYCLIQMSTILQDVGDYYASQEIALEVTKLLNHSDTNQFQYIAINYNNLANSIAFTSSFNEAVPYHNLAIKFSLDSSENKVYTNNKAVTLFDAKRYIEALGIYTNILNDNKLDNVQYARVLSNYANTKWRIDKKYNPIPDLHKALQIRINENDSWGQNSSYSHLFLFHENRSRDSAFFYAKKSYNSAIKLNSPSDRLIGLNQVIKSINTDSVKHYFLMYKKLDDSVQLAKVNAGNQYALIRFDSEKNKSENLKLQKEIIDKDLIDAKEKMIFSIIILLAIFGVSGFIFWSKKRKEHLILESNNRIKENQLKTSRKIHDVVANGIYRVMTEIEYKEHLDRDEILDKLELMYEKSRDISYEVEDLSKEQSFSQVVSTLLKSFATDRLKVIIVGNDNHLWNNFSKEFQEQLILVFQELMVNMHKHSNAKEVSFQMEDNSKILNIYYKDNGFGFPKNKKNGKGLINTETRIERLGGTITFVSEEGKGVKINIRIPIL